MLLEGDLCPYMRPTLIHTAALLGHKQGVYALAKGLEPGIFYTSGTDGQVAEWTTECPGEALGIAKLAGACWAMTALPDSGLLVLAQNGEGLHFIEARSRTAVGSLALGNAQYFALLPLAGNRLAVADSLGRVLRVDPIARRIEATVQVSDKPLRTLALVDPKTLAAAGSDGQIRLLDAESLHEKARWAAHNPTVMVVCPLPGERLASAGRDARIKTWDLSGAKPVLQHDVAAHHYSVYDLALHPGGELLLSASMDKTLKLWDASTLRLLRVIDKPRHNGHSSSVNRCLWLSSTEAVSCSDDRSAILWQLGAN